MGFNEGLWCRLQGECHECNIVYENLAKLGLSLLMFGFVLIVVSVVDNLFNEKNSFPYLKILVGG